MLLSRSLLNFGAGSLGIALLVAGCSSEDDRGDRDRFTPGDLSQKQDGEKCDAAVCAPDPQEPDASKGDPKEDPNACSPKNTCATATDLGAINADEGSDTRSRQGTGSQFFTLEAKEADGSGIGKAMRVAVTLISPKNTNYDLFVYGNDCSVPEQSSTQGLGTTDKAAVSWGETLVSNGSNDGRPLRIEVRNASATCDPNETWTLLVQGNAE